MKLHYFEQDQAARVVRSQGEIMRIVHHCDYCGNDIPACERWGNLPVTCGKQECERWARDEEAGEREEAHRQLDEDMGYGRF